MDDVFARQACVLRQLVSDYRAGDVGLNTLIQRIEGIGDVLAVDSWRDAVFPVVLEMEQVNAAALDERRALTDADKAAIESSLRGLEALILRFELSTLNRTE